MRLGSNDVETMTDCTRYSYEVDGPLKVKTFGKKKKYVHIFKKNIHFLQGWCLVDFKFSVGVR
jgi:hypothetical protein